jgi:hypothetical protein
MFGAVAHVNPRVLVGRVAERPLREAPSDQRDRYGAVFLALPAGAASAVALEPEEAWAAATHSQQNLHEAV